MALPCGTTGSLSPTFVPARLVGLAVKLPSAFTLKRMISNHSEGTFERLRYLLGGDRPSQTAYLTMSPNRATVLGWIFNTARVVSHRPLPVSYRSRFQGSHLSCTSCTNIQYQITVKLHGVFPSSRGYWHFSAKLYFTWISFVERPKLFQPSVCLDIYLQRIFLT